MSQRPIRTEVPLGMPVYSLHKLSVSELNPSRGQPGQRKFVPLPENSWAFTDLVSAINLGLEILESPPGRGALIGLASKLTESWRVQNLPLFRGTNQLAHHVDTFLSAIRSDFFTISIDDLGAPGVLAASDRRLDLWNGDLQRYQPKGHAAVSYNHCRVKDMVSASAAVDRIDRGRDTSEARAERKKMLLRHKHFQFMFATATAHEMCHIFVGYLSQNRRHGGRSTPPGITHLDYGRHQGADMNGRYPGESGRWFENKLFGGTLEFYQDSSDDSGQVGVLHVLDAKDVAWQIKPQAILNFIETGRRFEFPLEKTGKGIARQERAQRGIRSMGSTQSAPYNADYLFMRAKPERVALYSIPFEELRNVPERPRIVRAVRVA